MKCWRKGEFELRFKNSRHESDYNEFVKRSKCGGDVYYNALFYLLSLDETLSRNINCIYDFKQKQILFSGLGRGFQTSGSINTARLAINLFTNVTPASGIVKFEYADNEYNIVIKNASAYPQAFAATMLIFNKISTQNKVFIFDIGGFTVDYVVMKKGRAVFEESDSLDKGIIVLYNTIKSKIIGRFGLTLDESDIDLIIGDESSNYEEDIVCFVKEILADYVSDLFGEIRERGLDLRTGKTVFVGGGSIALKHFIQKSVAYSDPEFIDDIKANLKGYEILYNIEHKGGGCR